jgi:hypothetical protein
MHPEDRLDVLLSALYEPEPRQPRTSRSRAGAPLNGNGAVGTSGPAGDDTALAPLLETARRLAPLAAAQPDPRFARTLHARVLARAAERREAVGARGRRSARLQMPARGWYGIRHGLIAATVVLALSLGTLTVAAAANPGSPLFGLHRLEQGVQVAVTGNSADRARLHLAYARQVLAALRDAAAQHEGDAPYMTALQALQEEDSAAASEIVQTQDGATRAALTSELNALRDDERSGLQAALPLIGWPDRVATTQALANLGVTAPMVSGATLSTGDGGWDVSVSGAGFEAGAVLLVNGQPAGHVTSVTPSALVARLRFSDNSAIPQTLGIGNPDGTAAVTTRISVKVPPEPGDGHEGRGTPQPTEGSHQWQGTATPGQNGTATPGQNGTAVDGTVASVSSSSFVLNTLNGQITVQVNNSTQYVYLNGLQSLSPGMHVRVKGSFQQSAIFLATEVDKVTSE